MREILRGAREYAATSEPSIRTSVRAKVLSLIERVEFGPQDVTPRLVQAEELTRESPLRGAIQLHVDLVFRNSLTSEELLFSAARGWVHVAEHPSLPDFPVGVSLSLPANKTIRQRHELFEESGPSVGSSSSIVIYSIATSPPGLGAGAALIKAIKNASRALRPAPSLIAFSPLTGMRARIIGMVDDAATWSVATKDLGEEPAAVLRQQLFELLAPAQQPETVPQSARVWLSQQAHLFASSDAYRAGSFHRSMGAQLVGIAEAGDDSDGESMWMRAYYEYSL